MLLLTSIYEPFGLIMPEAMSCGLPVVAFDCHYGPKEIVTDGEDGFLVENRDIEFFAQRVCQLIENGELRQQMGKNAIQKAQRYSSDIIMPMWKELFDSLKK
jgi:glycosyltransferase involved in cell wall biosynthesis